MSRVPSCPTTSTARATVQNTNGLFPFQCSSVLERSHTYTTRALERESLQPFERRHRHREMQSASLRLRRRGAGEAMSRKLSKYQMESGANCKLFRTKKGFQLLSPRVSLRRVSVKARRERWRKPLKAENRVIDRSSGFLPRRRILFR